MNPGALEPDAALQIHRIHRAIVAEHFADAVAVARPEIRQVLFVLPHQVVVHQQKIFRALANFQKFVRALEIDGNVFGAEVSSDHVRWIR